MLLYYKYVRTNIYLKNDTFYISYMIYFFNKSTFPLVVIFVEKSHCTMSVSVANYSFKVKNL